MKKLNCYSEKTKDGRYVGKCKQYPGIAYYAETRDAATSGARRLAQKFAAAGAPTSAPVASPATTTSGKRKVNRFVFVIDRSGSMSSLTRDSVKALNDNIRTIREQSRKTGQAALITVIAFNTSVQVIRSNTNVEVIEPVRESEVYASGGTALFDAVGTAIETLEGTWLPADEDPSYLVMAITDGEENGSSRFGSNSNPRPLTEMMRRVQATDRWTLTFLVPMGYKNALVRMGIPDGNVSEWEQSSRGVQTYSQQNTMGFNSYFAARSVGLNSVKAFYTDLSNVSAKQVKSQLDDISSAVRVLPVEKEVDIKTFCEQKLGQYRPGSAFYQLTKDEKLVQAYKELLVMEKGKKAVFGGDDARSVLGIPEGQNLKIKPGNHGNFDIFVQSTSLNRKLVRGTKLLVKTN